MGISEQTTVVADSGSENVNGAVDDLLDGEALTRVLAQVEITFSNSMIEAFWRSLKHAWLYLHPLDSFAALRRLTEFYVKAHDGRKRSFRVMPHAAFEGQTPDETYFGAGEEVTQKFFAARKTARAERMKENRDAAYASGRRVRGRCYCHGRGPECREAQQGSIWPPGPLDLGGEVLDQLRLDEPTPWSEAMGQAIQEDQRSDHERQVLGNPAQPAL
jgi:hypothetical protein